MSKHVIVKDGIEYRDPRDTRAWRALRDQVVREEPSCRLRFTGICTVTSTTADHIKPVETHPELAMDRANLRGACKACNKARGSAPDEVLRLGEGDSPALSIFAR